MPLNACDAGRVRFHFLSIGYCQVRCSSTCIRAAYERVQPSVVRVRERVYAFNLKWTVSNVTFYTFDAPLRTRRTTIVSGQALTWRSSTSRSSISPRRAVSARSVSLAPTAERGAPLTSLRNRYKLQTMKLLGQPRRDKWQALSTSQRSSLALQRLIALRYHGNCYEQSWES